MVDGKRSLIVGICEILEEGAHDSRAEHSLHSSARHVAWAPQHVCKQLTGTQQAQVQTYS